MRASSRAAITRGGACPASARWWRASSPSASKVSTGNSVAEACAAPGPVCCHGASPGTQPPTATERVSVLVSMASRRSGGEAGEAAEGIRPLSASGMRGRVRRGIHQDVRNGAFARCGRRAGPLMRPPGSIIPAMLTTPPTERPRRPRPTPGAAWWRALGAGLLGALALPLPALADDALPPTVQAALRRAAVPASAVSALVVPVSGARGERLRHRAGQPINPASVMKLVTTYAAIDLLGPDFKIGRAHV